MPALRSLFIQLHATCHVTVILVHASLPGWHPHHLESIPGTCCSSCCRNICSGKVHVLFSCARPVLIFPLFSYFLVDHLESLNDSACNEAVGPGRSFPSSVDWFLVGLGPADLALVR